MCKEAFVFIPLVIFEKHYFKVYEWVFVECMETQKAMPDPLDWSYGLQRLQYRASLTQQVSSVFPTSWCLESMVL